MKGQRVSYLMDEWDIMWLAKNIWKSRYSTNDIKHNSSYFSCYMLFFIITLSTQLIRFTKQQEGALTYLLYPLRKRVQTDLASRSVITWNKNYFRFRWPHNMQTFLLDNCLYNRNRFVSFYITIDFAQAIRDTYVMLSSVHLSYNVLGYVCVIRVLC